MTKKISLIIKEVVKKIKPEEKEISWIIEELENFLKELKKRIKKQKIKAEVFVGGSFAKKTLIKKDKYDIDIFLRFDSKYNNSELSNLTKNILKGIKGLEQIHGSRDYFQVKAENNLYFEIVPVRKIGTPAEAKNITDLSYSHVKYVNKKTNKKILNEILVAKAFCHAKNCYGAESYIKGFSGYALELLIIYYKTFEKFIREIAKSDKQIIIDIEKHFSNKQRVLIDLNESKLHSPIILIDPTYKQRNALAALSQETFDKFKKACERFIKNPSIKEFEKEKINLEKIKKDSEKKKQEFIIIEFSTNKPAGDVAGSKLLKFYNHVCEESSKFFKIKKRGFEYDGKQGARAFLVAEKKKELIIEGPDLQDKENVRLFKKAHKKTFLRKEKVFAREKIDKGIKEFLKEWKRKNQIKTREMKIKEFGVF